MEEISVIGIDLAKRVFQVCCRDACGGIVVEKRLGRGAFMRFMSRQAAGILVGLEACGGSHYWGRWLVARGFRVKMMSPYAVKAYVSGAQKSDAIEARGNDQAHRPTLKPSCPATDKLADRGCMTAKAKLSLESGKGPYMTVEGRFRLKTAISSCPDLIGASRTTRRVGDI